MTEYNQIPYEALTYLVGECNYGGKVTDQRDRRCLMSLLELYLNPSVLDPKFTFANVAGFPSSLSFNEYLSTIKVQTSQDLFPIFELIRNFIEGHARFTISFDVRNARERRHCA